MTNVASPQRNQNIPVANGPEVNVVRDLAPVCDGVVAVPVPVCTTPPVCDEPVGDAFAVDGSVIPSGLRPLSTQYWTCTEDKKSISVCVFMFANVHSADAQRPT